jgi:hypothetical protein
LACRNLIVGIFAINSRIELEEGTDMCSPVLYSSAEMDTFGQTKIKATEHDSWSLGSLKLWLVEIKLYLYKDCVIPCYSANLLYM